MTVEELKRKIDAYQTGLEAKSGNVVLFSENGPASMGLIDALYAVVARQQREIDELRARLPQ